jgi:hypothetical protein
MSSTHNAGFSVLKGDFLAVLRAVKGFNIDLETLIYPHREKSRHNSTASVDTLLAFRNIGLPINVFSPD